MGQTNESPGASKLSRAAGWAMVGLIGLLSLGGAFVLVYETVRTAADAFHVTVIRHNLGLTRGRAFETSDYLVSPENIDSANSDVQRLVANRVVPGAVVTIGDSERIVSSMGYGRVGWRSTDEVASPDSTIYDLASLTKAVATTSAVLLLAQDGKISLDDPVQRWLPEFQGRWKDRVTWRHLLTHTSGLPPAARLRGRAPSQILHSVLNTSLDEPPGTGVQYSDVSFIVLWTAAQRAAGEPLPDLLERRIWQPLGMHSTEFWPGASCENCAPTMTLRSGQPYRGKPSDPTAHKLGRPSGNAGLFSTAHDLGRFAGMIANGGELHGVRIFSPALVHELFIQQPDAGHRTLGWEAFCPSEHPTQQRPCARPIAYGHTGWTGTSLWIDPARGLWVVILSNRSYNVKHPPSLDELREDVFMDAAGLDSVDANEPAGSATAPPSPTASVRR
jgi:CubicO group peptidase (beta-lactamase class C family)